MSRFHPDPPKRKVIVNWNGIGNIAAKIIGTLFMLGFFLGGLLIYGIGGSSGGAGILAAILACACFMIASFFFIPIFLPGIAQGFTNFLLYPKHWLKTTPPALSEAMALIARRELPAAEAILLELFEEYPENTTVAWLLMDIYSEDHRDPEKAVRLAERYFDENRRRSGEENYSILLAACDQLQYLDCADAALERLENELRHGKCYDDMQKKGIQRRISALRH